MRTYFYLRKPLFRSPLVALVLVTAALTPGGFANPYGEAVVAGNASFDRTGSTLRVTTDSNRAIVNWQGFSINAGETTRFLQPSSNAVMLNRVVSGAPSAIYGNLEANGRIFLINPNGVVVGASGRVDTAGFLASTLDVANQQFLSGGDLSFTGSSGASVVNRGTIRAVGGDILLLGGTVENSGNLNAPAGTVVLAAGSDILLKQAGDERVAVRPAGIAGGGVTNSGAIEAVQAELKSHGNLYALAINNSGVIRATGAASRGGRVFLTSAGGNIRHSGTITARNGGSVRINAGAGSNVTVSGQIDAASQTGKGGDVRLSGRSVALVDQAKINVSGFTGGGTALIGGDLHGANPEIRNALSTFVGRSASITADAINSGNGGKVVVWADDLTRFYGTLSACGGASSGNGGFAEISGKRLLDFAGSVNLSAPAGAKGTLLLDPDSINIVDSVAGSGNGDALLSGTTPEIHSTDVPATMTVSWGQINSLGATANVVLEAQNNITVNSMLTGKTTLTLSTGSITFHSLTGNIAFENPVDMIQTEGGGITFLADHGSLNLGDLSTIGDSGTCGAGGSGITLQASGLVSVGYVTTYRAPISITSSGDSVTTADLITNGSALITLKSASALTAAAVITTGTLVFSSVNGAALTNSANNFAAVTGTNVGGNIDLNNGASLLSVGSLSQTGGNVTIQNSGDIQLDDVISNQTGTVTLTADSLGAGTGGVHITSRGQIDSFGNVSVYGSDLISTGGLFDSIVIDAAFFRPADNPLISTEGNILLQNNAAAPADTAIRMAGLLWATGTTQFASPTALQGDSYLSGGVSFQSTLDGDKRLTIKAYGNSVTFDSPIGNTVALKAMTIASPRHVVVSGSLMRVESFSVTSGSGTTTIRGAITTASNGAVSIATKTIDFNSATPAIQTSGTGGVVTLDGDVWISGSTSIISGGNIVQRGTVSGTNDLSMRADTGRITFYGSTKNLVGGSIGGYELLKSLTLTANQIVLQPDIKTINDQTYTVTDALTRIGGGRFFSTLGKVTFNGTVTENPGLTLEVRAPVVEFNGTVNLASGGLRVSSESLVLNGALNSQGTIILAPLSATRVIVGGTNSVVPDAMAITQSTLAALASGTLAGLTIGCNNGQVIVNDAVSVPYALTFTTTGVGSAVVINAPVEVTGANKSLYLAGIGNQLNSDLSTNGGAITLNALTIGSAASITSNGGAVTFASSVNGSGSGYSAAVQSGTGNITFKGVVGGTTPLALNLQSSGTTMLQNVANVSSLTTGTTGVTALYSIVNATDTISFHNAVKLMGNVSVNAWNSVEFAGAVSNGASKRSLSVRATTGTISFASTVGVSGTTGGGPLASLTLTSPQGDLEQSGNWNVDGNTTLNALGHSILLAQNNNFGTLSIVAADATINEASNIDLGLCNLSGSLTLSSPGIIAFRNLLTAGSLTTSATGTSALYSATLTTTGDITFANPVKLFTNPTLKAGGAISFQNTVSNGSGSRALILTASSGAISFASTVGVSGTAGSGPLAALTLTSPQANLTQSGDWNVTGATTLNALGHNIVLGAHNNFGTLSLNAINAAINEDSNIDLGVCNLSGSLTLSSPGVIAFRTNLTAGSITTGATGTAALYASTLASTGNITFANPVKLFANPILRAGGAISFQSTVANGSGSHSLTLTATTGAISFASTVGVSGTAGGGPLAALTLNSPQANLTQAADWNVVGATALNSWGHNIVLAAHNNFGTLSLNAANATINEDSNIDLGVCNLSGTLSLSSPGIIAFRTNLAIGGITTSATGTSALYASTFDATGNIIFGNPVQLFASHTLRAGGSISFQDTVANGSGSRSLALTATSGAISFASTVGVSGTAGGGPLAALTLISPQANLTQAADWNVAGITTLNALGHNIVLTRHNNFGALSINAANATISEDSNIDLGTCNLSGTLSLNSLGIIALRANLPTGSLTTGVTGTTALYTPTLTTTGDLTFGNPIKLFAGSTLKAGGAISFQDTVSNGLGNQSLTLTATNGAISFASTVGTPESALAALTLTSSLNGFTQGASSHWNVTGLTTLNTAGRDILLNATQNNLGILNLTGRNVSISENSATILGTSAISGNLTVNSTGTITNATATGALQATGTSRFIAGGAITLGAVGNRLAGPVIFQPGGSSDVLLVNGTNTLLGAMSLSGNLTLTSGGSTNFGASTFAGNLTVNSVGSITQSGAIQATGTTSLTCTGANSTIILNTPGNRLTSISKATAPLNIDIRTSVGTLTVSGTIKSAGGKVILTATGGNLILAAGSEARISAERSILATNNNFVNYSNSRAIVGNYLIYSGTQASVVTGGLVSDLAYPHAPYPSDADLSANLDGHRFYFAN